MVLDNAWSSSSDLPGLDALITLREAAKHRVLSPSHLRLLISRGDTWGL